MSEVAVTTFDTKVLGNREVDTVVVYINGEERRNIFYANEYLGVALGYNGTRGPGGRPGVEYYYGDIKVAPRDGAPDSCIPLRCTSFPRI